jgi:hypothetical protein
MREIRQSGSEGGVVGNGHPYPYNFSSVKVSKAEFEGGGWLVV